MLLSLIILAIIAGAALAFSAITDWIASNKKIDTRYATIIKKKLSTGEYKIISGIFDNSHRQQASYEWQTKSLDSELQEKFGNADIIKIMV